MTDITDAIIRHVENRRASPPPYVDLAAPEVVLHLRVRLKIGTDEVIIEDDDTPSLIAALQGRVTQCENKLREDEGLLLKQVQRSEIARDRMHDLESRLNLMRDQVADLLHKAAVARFEKEHGEREGNE